MTIRFSEISQPRSNQIVEDSSTTMPTISLSSSYIDSFALDLYSNDPRGPPKFIEHYTMKVDDGSESFAYTAFLTIEFSKAYEPLQLKEVEEISATSRCPGWLDVSDSDGRNKALEGVFKELQRRKCELILNELKKEMMRRYERESKERLRASELQWRYLMDWGGRDWTSSDFMPRAFELF